MYRSAVAGTGAGNGSSPGPTCQSCGLAQGPFELVRRVYLEADGRGGLRVSETVEDVERWCPACCAVYPHEPARG